MKPSIFVSHPFGNANVRQAALALSEAKLLSRFYTCINWPENSAWNRLFPKKILSQLQRRTFPPEISASTSTQPIGEFLRLAAMRFGWKSWITHETGRFSVDAISCQLDTKVARELEISAFPPSAIYAYEDGASTSFAAAKKRQITCLYDLPIGYWKKARAIQNEEAELQPEWASTLTAMIDSPAKLARKDAELADADAVFVASKFTAGTLMEYHYPEDKIHIIPYGCPPPLNEVAPAHTGPLRVLFAGSLGQRKGTSYLLSAIEKLGKHVTLTLLGSRPAASCFPLDQALKTHRWLPSLPHSEVLREMRQHDVLVFPSLFEGFGLVITEALSQGIPVITTPNTAGPDLLTEGEDGFIIPIRDEQAIAEKLEFLLENVDYLRAMKAAALRKAGLFTWHKYRSSLVAQVSDLLS